MSLVIPALGQPFVTGCLYNAHKSEIMVGHSLWDMRPTNNVRPEFLRHINRVQYQHTDITYGSASSLNERLTHFDISADIKMSFVGGLLDARGSASYLTDNNRKIDKTSVTLLATYKTRHEHVWAHSLLNPQFISELRDSGATHVVTGIDFGARACVEFYIEDDDSRIETSISGQLEANIRGLLQGDAEMNLREVEACRSKNVKCRVNADCLSGPICDVSSVRKFIEEFGSKVEQSGGVPCTVYMMPLSAFCNDIVIIMNAIEETSLQIVKEYMELYDACKRKLRSLALYSELNYLQEHCNTLSSRFGQ
jgi:hypothetical protein